MMNALLQWMGLGKRPALPDDAAVDKNARRSMKRVVMIVNPASGTGDAWHLAKAWELLLKTSRVNVELLVSQHPGDGRRLACTAFPGDSASKTGQICVAFGGDGHIHDVVNGLNQAGALTMVALCVVPVGTGNGICASVGVRLPAEAFLALTNPQTIPLDILHCKWHGEYGEERSCSSALSVGWGAVADHDYYVEREWRWMGYFRTLVAPIMVIAKLKTYSGTLWFKEGIQLALSHHKLSNPERIVDGDSVQWLKLCDDFFFVHVCNLPWIAHDAVMAPMAKPGDGLMHVVIMRSTTRLDAIRMFLASDSGAHVKLPQVEVFSCSGFKLEPKSADGNIAIDGEAIPCGPVTVECLPHATQIHTAVNLSR